jgi:hypothetical protein
MAIAQAMTGSYKQQITAGIHFWTSHSRTGGSVIAADAFWIAMFTSSRSDANQDLTGYTSTNEVTDSQGVYTAGGQTVGTATLGLANNTLATAGTGGTTTHAAKPSVCVLDFGGNKSSSNGDFTIQYPANDANNAVIRIS